MEAKRAFKVEVRVLEKEKLVYKDRKSKMELSHQKEQAKRGFIKETEQSLLISDLKNLYFLRN